MGDDGAEEERPEDGMDADGLGGQGGQQQGPEDHGHDSLRLKPGEQAELIASQSGVEMRVASRP